MVTFITASALAITLLVVIPLLAHLLRRGGHEPVEFSLARLAKPSSKLATRKSRFDDRWLFALRALLIAALAVLGAAPLIRCERPTLARQHGASVALAIVLDDSASMRVRLRGSQNRFELARQTAAQLISDLREGDVVSLVFAGRPARLLVAATPQLRLARELCATARESDRSTDLAGAIELAENSLRNLPQVDRRIAVLSDLAEPIEKPHANLWLPLPQLAGPVQDCGVITANQRANQVEVTVACTTAASSKSRRLALAPAQGATQVALPAGQQLDQQKSLQTLVFGPIPSGLLLNAQLDGTDDNPHNDVAPVFAGISGTVVATLSDYTTARAATGGPPLVEQALSALESSLIVRPWSTLPEDARAYTDVSLLVLDDPNTFGPEVRSPLLDWLNRGGTAVAFLGPRAVSDQLGMSLSPFIEGPTSWSATPDMGLDTSTLKWLGTTAASWADIHARSRLEFEQAIPAGSAMRGRWRDERPALFETQVGRGTVWTVAVPVSPALSDIALRPAFLALLDRLINTARQRGLSPITLVGQPWKLDKQDQVTVTGPDTAPVLPSTPAALAQNENWYTPTLSGAYTFRRQGRRETRVAHVEAAEILEPSRSTLARDTQKAHDTPNSLEAAPYVAASIAALLLLELVAKSTVRWGRLAQNLRRLFRSSTRLATRTGH